MYKGGYVWQDLLDDDLITPICDNQYVLKGSEISSTTLNNGKLYLTLLITYIIFPISIIPFALN